jgi:cytochrome c553
MNRRSKGAVLVLLLIAAGGWVGAFAQSQNAGAAEIILEGGTSGKVTFPHQRHQEKLTDCTICHAAFPQKTGAIEELKAQGKLAKKQIMNELCTQCHKEKQRAGEKSGPTTCTTCHVKA